MLDADKMPAFLNIAKYIVDPSDVTAFKMIIARMAKGAREAPGSIFLNAAQDVIDPNTFHLIEGWASSDLADEYLKSDKFQAVLRDALSLRIAYRSGTIYFVSHVQPLKMPT